MPRHSLRVERFVVLSVHLGPVELVRRQYRKRAEVNEERERHADAGCREAVMPAELLAERAADERCQKRARR